MEGLFARKRNAWCAQPAEVSPDNLERKLDLSGVDRRRGQLTRNAGRCSRRIENVGVIGEYRHGEVGVIQDIEELRPELHIETFRNPPDIVILEKGKIQVRNSWSDQDVATGIAP